MALISLEIPQSALAQLLSILERIARAAEKIAGPNPPSHPQYRATEKDLLVATPGHVESRAKETAALALESKKLPGSQAALEWMVQLEADLRAQMPGPAGERAIADLPWKRVQRADQQT